MPRSPADRALHAVDAFTEAPKALPAPRRARLVEPLPALAALSAVLLALWAALPSRAALRSQTRDGLALAYLRLLVLAHPGEAELKLQLGQALLEAGQPAAALKALQGVDERALSLRLRAQVAAWRELPPGSAARVQEAARLGALLDQAGAQLLPLPPLALELGQPAVAARLFERLAASEPAQRASFLQQAAQAWLAAGDPDQAARPAAAAALLLHDEAAALRAVAIVRGARRAQPAVLDELAAAFPEDAALLDAAAAAALAMNDVQRARRWAKDGLRLAGETPERLERQLSLELAAGNVQGALPLAERLAALEPANRQLRARLARIAEWCGHEELALQQWLSVGREDEALRLARGTHARRTVAALLEERRTLDGAALREYARALTDEVGAAAAGLTLRRYAEAHDQPQAWQLAFELLEQGGDARSALQVQRVLARRLGDSAERQLARARLLAALGEPRAAAAELTLPDAAVLKLRAALAWQLGDRAGYLRAAQALLALDALDEVGMARLSLTARALLGTSALEALAARLRGDAALLDAAEALQARGRKASAARALARVSARTPRYWMLRARSAASAREAEQAFLRAPREPLAREGLLQAARAANDEARVAALELDEQRESLSGVEQRGSLSGFEQRGSLAGFEQRGSLAGFEQRESLAGAERSASPAGTRSAQGAPAEVSVSALGESWGDVRLLGPQVTATLPWRGARLGLTAWSLSGEERLGLTFARDGLLLGAGALTRAGGASLQARAEWRRPLWHGAEAGLAAAWNDLDGDSGPLRAGALTQWASGRLGLRLFGMSLSAEAGARRTTFSGEALALGAFGSAELSRSLGSGLSARLSGSFAANDRTDQFLTGGNFLYPPSPHLFPALAPLFGTAGAGAAWSGRVSDRSHTVIDAWIGAALPDPRVALRLQALGALELYRGTFLEAGALLATDGMSGGQRWGASVGLRYGGGGTPACGLTSF